MATATTKLMTAEEFFDWCAQPENQDRRFELENGEVIEMPPPGDQHGTLCSWISHLLWAFAISRGRGRVNSNDAGLIVRRNPDTTRGADLMFFDESVPLSSVSRRYPANLPLLVVEVLSPNDSWGKTSRRVEQYLQAGVPMVWVVSPSDLTVTVFRPNENQQTLDESDELTGCDVLPDFRCRVADLFTLPGQNPLSASVIEE